MLVTAAIKRMIPRKLQIKNFLSYGPEIQTIDFSTYNLICLSGKNGHGKSALLDAITWALWGQARKVSDTAKPDENLLRLGQTQMLVILDFEFNQQLYRVRREYVKTYGKPITALDFGIIDEDDQITKPLTEKTIRDTQAKIEKILNLDAESFVNSAFLRQGQSNEFSKKSAKERKEVLANILGISRYETVRKAALEKIKDAQTHKTALATLLESISKELERKDALLLQKNLIAAKLDDHDKQEQLIEKMVNTIASERSVLTHEKEQHSLLVAQAQRIKTAFNKDKQALAELRTQWRVIQRKITEQGSNRDLEAEKRTNAEQITHQQTLLQQLLEIKEKILVTKEELHLARKKLLDEQDAKKNALKLSIERVSFEKMNLEKNIQELQTQALLIETEKKAYIDEKESLEKKVTAQHSETISSIEKQFEKRKEFYQKFIVHGNFLKNELASLEQKKQLVQEDDPSCPLCEQNLTTSRKKFLKSAFTKQEQIITNQIARITKILKRLKEILIKQHDVLVALKKDAEEQKVTAIKIDALGKTAQKNALQEKITKQQIQNYISAHEKKAHELAELQKNAMKLDNETVQLLASDSSYQTHVTALTTLENILEKISYNPQEHQRLLKMGKEIDQLLQEFQQLKNEIEMQGQRAQQIRHLCAQLKTIKQEHNYVTEKLAVFSSLTEKQDQLTKKEQELQHTVHTLRQTKEALVIEKATNAQALATLQKLEQDREEHHKKNNDFDRIIDTYQAIAAATGKDGIQALLIEDALPEIELETNQLLAKLTNNQAHVIIESLRDLKKGGAKETLDIKISDPLGIRPYEMFSGGEAFRIDFALRIAISKLLARRAGTSLQTLIIDEGFGSQDEEGLNHIMESLYKIQDDFAKILIVSHLPAMKDQFPVHFFVEKGPQGSLVKVIEND